MSEALVRLVLVAVLAHTGPHAAGRALCRRLVDAAADGVMVMPEDLLTGSGCATAQRFEAKAELDRICRACGGCPRGALTPTPTEKPDPAGADGPGNKTSPS